MPSPKHLMIFIILISSCHTSEPEAIATSSKRMHTVLIDSAHPFYPYTDSSLPFTIPKERVTIYEKTIYLLPALYPPCYGIALKGKGWLPPELGLGDSAPFVIDSPSTNWPHPPRAPRVYHF